MLNKLKKILQWFVSVCFILSGLIYVGEYTVPAIVLMVLAGVIVPSAGYEENPGIQI